MDTIMISVKGWVAGGIAKQGVKQGKLHVPHGATEEQILALLQPLSRKPMNVITLRTGTKKGELTPHPNAAAAFTAATSADPKTMIWLVKDHVQATRPHLTLRYIVSG
jgi:hypothetical protein